VHLDYAEGSADGISVWVLVIRRCAADVESITIVNPFRKLAKNEAELRAKFCFPVRRNLI
jgi:hypothetical protein